MLQWEQSNVPSTEVIYPVSYYIPCPGGTVLTRNPSTPGPVPVEAVGFSDVFDDPRATQSFG